MLKIVSSILSEYAGLPDRFEGRNCMLTGNMETIFSLRSIFLLIPEKMLFHECGL